MSVASAYRTVSEDATLVMTAIPPVDLLASERQAIYNGRSKEQVRELTTEKWQERWDTSTNGRWTHRLIVDLRVW